MTEFKDKKKEEEDEDVEDDSDDEVPDLNEVYEGGNKPDDSKQSKGEKKARKAMLKLGMRPVTGVTRVTLKKSRTMMFVISQPDVFKSPNSDTYIIFGEAKVEDMAANATSQAAEQFKAPDAVKKPAVIPAPAAAPNKKATVTEEGNVDESGVDPKDIELVVAQAGCTRSQAVIALKNNENDIVNAIMELTM
eukprot:gene6464-13057_t